MRKVICLAAVVLLGGFVYAGQGGYLSKDEPDLTTCERALPLLGKGDRKGFDVLFEQWPDKTDAGENTTQDLTEAQAPTVRKQVKTLGEFHGFELVRGEEVGHCLRRYTYVCKHDRGVARWSFTFYRPADEWRFQGYDFNSDEHGLFVDCAHSLPIEDAKHPIAGRSDATRSR